MQMTLRKVDHQNAIDIIFLLLFYVAQRTHFKSFHTILTAFWKNPFGSNLKSFVPGTDSLI